MFGTFFGFELRFWLRSIMLYVFLLIVAAMIFGAVSTDQVRVGASLENTYRNAPFVIQQFYAFMSLLTLLMTTAFVNSAATRDFAHNTYQILFTTPLRKNSYLLGRFWAATLVSVIPQLGVTLAIVLAKYMPWVDAERWGPVRWDAHAMGLVTHAIPNTIFISAIVFAIAALTRSTVVSFLGSLGLLVAYSVAGELTSDLDNERMAAMLDPFGLQSFFLMTKYTTVAERNNMVTGVVGDLLWNRLLWVGVGMAILAFTCWRFQFTERRKRSKKNEAVDQESRQQAAPVVVPAASQRYDGATRWRQFLGHARIEFLAMVRTTSFIVIVVAALLNVVPALILSAKEGYGLSQMPVTYRQLEIIRGAMYIFLISLLTYFGGVLIWRERDARCDEIHDALPYPNWIAYGAKLFSLLSMIVILQLLMIAIGVSVQAWQGYTRFQIDLYVTEMLGLDLLQFVFLAVLAFFIHVLSPNKYIGYFAFIAFTLVNAFAWRPLNIATNMVKFGEMPSYTYSDLYGYAPYTLGMSWFAVYWLLFCGLLVLASTLLWPRGRETGVKTRLWNAKLGFAAGAPRKVAVVLGAAFLAVGGWVYYNTLVLNQVRGPKDLERLQADYEKTYKKYEKLPQPRIQSVKYWIDIYPEQRNVVMRAEQIIANKHAKPLDQMHLNVDTRLDVAVETEGAKLDREDKRLGYRTYRFTPPLAPGEQRLMKFTVKTNTRGFENNVSQRRIVQNGTFFDTSMTPAIGYQSERELSSRNDRRNYGLPEKDLMPALVRDCGTDKCSDPYVDTAADWVDVETVISTSPDQIAIAPGSLRREWTENGRRYFSYKLDHKALNFYSFLSARYEVAREEFDGIRSEVYYHKDHHWNVPKMQKSIRKTLEYCTRNFGPYRHQQARIIEFPRVATFAQAFPGTMPYSEGIGFVASIEKPDDIDMVYYVVAHEMGHQWWAHQVVGAKMQGATLLSETLAQYTALMVMEKEYGRDMMRKFLEYEMDNYLRARGRELLKERPLQRVEAQQGYIHYRKGSVVIYYLKEMIGEEAVNRALRKVIEQYAYQGPPYPTSYALTDALKAETPADLHYLFDDLFSDITLFANRTLSAKAAKRSDGKYDVTLEVESKKLKADEKGFEKEVPINDWIEIGAFAKPDKGTKYGPTLYRERVRITTDGKRSFTFTVDQLPDKVGIDPFHLLVDRIPSDNMKRPEEVS